MPDVISQISAREILDSRGRPTVEVDVMLASGVIGRACVPSGASTGAYEAHELRDGEKNRYGGKGVLKVVKNIKEILDPALKGHCVLDQKKLDGILKEKDGTPNKSRLGANALLGVSLAYARAGALSQNQPLYEFLKEGAEPFCLPVPLINILNGGAHADNGLDVQEFMIVPVCGGSFREAIRSGSEIIQSLKKLLSRKGLSTSVGDEGGFAPRLKNNKEALECLLKAIEEAGYRPGEDVFLALDVASTEFFEKGFYKWEGQRLTGEQLSDIYEKWQKEFPLVSLEDGFAEEDWESWVSFTRKQGDHIQLVGDDLFVTNPDRLAKGLEQKAANALLVKVNQIGTLTEAKEAVQQAQKGGYNCVMSHRSGETEDTFIADLCVAWHCSQIKTGSLCRSERVAKYNQLLRIEEALGDKAVFRGQKVFV